MMNSNDIDRSADELVEMIDQLMQQGGGRVNISSCSKKCYCKATLNGEELAGKTVENDSGKACSSYNYRANVLGQTVEYKCSPSL